MPKLPPLSDNASWLINAGADDTQRRLAAMTGTPEEITDLHHAIEHETANGNRVSRLKPIQAKLAKFQRGAHTAHTADVEIVTDAQSNEAELSGIAESIDQSIDLVAKFEASFEESTLEHRLEIGLQIAKAQEIFTLSYDQRQGIGGRPSETLSQRDTVSKPAPVPHGFVSWLGKNVPRLKRPTAYKYAKAFRALDLPLDAKPVAIREAIKTLRHQAGKAGAPMPTLGALVKAAPKLPKPDDIIVAIPRTSKQLRLEDARLAFHEWRESFDESLKRGHLDHLDKRGLEELKEFVATVRDRINARLK